MNGDIPQRSYTFVDNHTAELQDDVENRKDKISDYHKQLLYLQAYRPREKLKFKEIPEVSKALGPQHTIIARFLRLRF